MNSNPFGFGGMGYHDPLGSGPRMGIGQFMQQGAPPMGGMQIGAPPVGPAAPGRMGIGSLLKKAGGWIAQPENMNAITNVIGTGMAIHGARQDRKLYEGEIERQREMEEEQRRRYDSWNPQRQELLNEIIMRRGG